MGVQTDASRRKPTPDPSELARGVHRLELERDNKPFGYHALDGSNGSIVADPGFTDAPETDTVGRNPATPPSPERL